MIIQRLGDTYYAPDTATDLGADGFWTPISHAKLLPVAIKGLQDERARALLSKPPSDADLLAWAKLHNPDYLAYANAQQLAASLQQQAAAAWDTYKARMATIGIVVPNTAPDYGAA